MFQKVNYIIHLNCVFETIVNDDRLSPFHVSLYFSLFQYWNISKFRNPISINREEMMRASKIGSANTYTKCLKELNEWQYINYLPSHSPLVGSKVYLYTFNKTTDKTINKTDNNATDISADKSNGQTTEKALRPSINSLNNKNKINKINKTNEYGPKRKKITKNLAPDFKRGEKETKPTPSQIKNYFAGKNWPEIEAEKFFNYFESNGWLVGGKTPMKNWQAAAKNWMLNANKFSNEKKGGQSPKANGRSGRLSANENKNYAEPL